MPPLPSPTVAYNSQNYTTPSTSIPQWPIILRISLLSVAYNSWNYTSPSTPPQWPITPRITLLLDLYLSEWAALIMLQNIEHNASSSLCFQLCIQSPPAQWLITPGITLPPSNSPTIAYKSQNYTTGRLAVLIIHNTPDHVATLSAAQLQKIEHNTS